MKDKFLVSEDQLIQLTATRSGRISYAGYNYQCGYAVSRLASMATSKPLFNLKDYPRYLRYDWGEDLDEVLNDDCVCFTQCKRVDDICEPKKLAEILLGFAPKWLWTPADSRDRIQFRLVCCDPRFRADRRPEDIRLNVLDQFEKLLRHQPSPRSDRFLWQKDAETVGFEILFDALWERLSFVHLDKTIISDDPAGVVLLSEATARDLLLKFGLATASTQQTAIANLRCLINKNIIAFDPTNDECLTITERVPVRIDAAEVQIALMCKKEGYKSAPFTLIDRVFLSNARLHPKEKFLFESPEWHHVVRGTDKDIKFIEREQTDALRNRVRDSLIRPLLHGTSNLPALFVTGPPGSGKSTLVRRVVAILVESGEVVAADAGLILADGPDDSERNSYLESLGELACAGRPVLLVLDDPLFEGSRWIKLLNHLKQPGYHVAVIAATPDFLFQKYRSRLSKLSCHEFSVAPPSFQEKIQFADIYDRDISFFSKSSEEFLVMVAEAESGMEYPKIMERLWLTLNGGLPFNENTSFCELPWEVRAFWFVCLIHRCYTFCPLPILKQALEISGGTGAAINVETALAKLKAQSGWSIFKYQMQKVSAWSYQGDCVSTAHHQIASAAWNQRPMKWFDPEVNDLIAKASVLEPQSVRNIATAALMLANDTTPHNSLAKVMLNHWQQAALDPQRLETRQLCEIISHLLVNNYNELGAPIHEALRARAIGKDGWLAAWLLFLLSSNVPKSRSFPEYLDLTSLITHANFALAPTRAIKFFKELGGQPKLIDAARQRLFECLEERLDWQIDSHLLGWLISHSNKSECANRLPYIVNWLECHDEDSYVRMNYLCFLQGLPELYEHHKQASRDIARWLCRHDEDTAVRARYLCFLESSPPMFEEQRKQAVTDTESWLTRHDNDTQVRSHFLTFLLCLPNEYDQRRKHAVTDTESWLARHDNDTYVRSQYLTFLLGLPEEYDQRLKQAITDTESWLARHDYDNFIRAKYLMFLERLPAGVFDIHRVDAALTTSKWLNRHPNANYVRDAYVYYLSNVRLEALNPLRKESDKHHKWLISKNPGKVRYNYCYGEQLRSLSRFDEAILQYDAVLNLHKNHQMARRGRAISLQNIGQMQEAEAEFMEALWWAKKQNQSLSIFFTSLGEFYLAAGRWQDASESFEQAQSESPDYFGNHWGIAKAQVELGNFDKAEEALKGALADQNLNDVLIDELMKYQRAVHLRRTGELG